MFHTVEELKKAFPGIVIKKEDENFHMKPTATGYDIPYTYMVENEDDDEDEDCFQKYIMISPSINFLNDQAFNIVGVNEDDDYIYDNDESLLNFLKELDDNGVSDMEDMESCWAFEDERQKEEFYTMLRILEKSPKFTEGKI